GAVGSHVVVVDTVHEEKIVGIGIAVDREVAAARQTFVSGIEAVSRGNAWRERDQAHKVFAVKRKLADLLALDHFAYGGGGRLNLHVAGFDGDAFSRCTHGELSVQFSHRGRVNFDVLGD